ncbi:MAG: dihydroorotate dehydrogenase electron transfer subunit [Desulfobacterales bacterium]|nr:dihydroorotate dehydrogenase electron transfer subunit [Desulfobacterales bacterium]
MEILNTPTNQRPVMLRVADKEVNSPDFATLFFEANLDFSPGQFLMVWIPGLDEKPYTIAYHSPDRFGITIEAKGIFSRKAVTLEKGDLVGIRGPFGRGFDILDSPNLALVAGGCGMAPLATLAEALNPNTFFVHGARSRDFLLYPDRFDTPRQFCTDDGSFGHKGFVTEILEGEIQRRKKAGEDPFERVYACGPEVMMQAVYQICQTHGIHCQVSLERYMRCGFGVCGACVCSDQVVCKDGPVFGSQELKKMKDFNTTALLKTGEAVPLNQYVSWRCQ